MNLIDAWVTEVIGEPYYDDYGSGNYKWWLKVSLQGCRMVLALQL